MGLFINDDFMRFVAEKYHEGYVFGEVGEQDVRAFVRQLAGTTVTDLVLNVNAQMSYSPSEVWMTAEEKYQTEEECGHAVSYKDTFYRVWHDLFILQGLDLYALWIEECRAAAIHPWLSFRLNDIHDNGMKYGGIRRSPWFASARERGLTRTDHREPSGYYDDCLDFKHKEVRDHHLDYIREQLLRYDVDGVELDLMREPFICSPGEEAAARDILHGFFCQVRALANEAEERYGHTVRLSVRTFRDPAAVYDAGVDIYRLVREGVVDLVIPTPRFGVSDNDMPIYIWKKTFEGTGIELAAGCEMHYLPNVEQTRETLAALAMQYLSLGAEHFYLFNHTYLKDYGVYSYLGDTQRLLTKVRRHIVSHQDLGYIHSTLYHPLPMPLCKDLPPWGYKYLRIQTGPVAAGARAVLRLGANAPIERVFVNSHPCPFLGYAREELYGGEVQEFLIEKCGEEYQMAEFLCSLPDSMLYYAEIRITPL